MGGENFPSLDFHSQHGFQLATNFPYVQWVQATGLADSRRLSKSWGPAAESVLMLVGQKYLLAFEQVGGKLWIV